MLFGNAKFLEIFDSFLYTRHKIMCATYRIITRFTVDIKIRIQR